MLVDVQRLRQGGKRIPAERVREARVIRGQLTLDLGYDMQRGRPAAYAVLRKGEQGLLPPLRNIRKIKIRDGAIYLLGGTECADTGGGRRFQDFEQSWRCVPVMTG